MKKGAFGVVSLGIVIGLLLAGCANGNAKDESFKIGILQLADVLAEVDQGFRTAMTDLGYIEGENVTYVYRNADFNPDNLGPMAQEMVDENVDLIVTITTPSSMVAMNVSQESEIPIVFMMVSDPIQQGVVFRPGEIDPFGQSAHRVIQRHAPEKEPGEHPLHQDRPE